MNARPDTWCDRVFAPASDMEAQLRAAGIPLLATAMSADAVDLRKKNLSGCAVVIGSEGRGVSAELFAAADGKIIIPMNPRCESLNAAAAATIVLWQMKC